MGLRRETARFRLLFGAFFCILLLSYAIAYRRRSGRSLSVMSFHTTESEISDPNSKLLIGIVTVPQSERLIDLLQTWGFSYESDPFSAGFVFMQINTTTFPDAVTLSYSTRDRDYLATVPSQDRIYNDRDSFFVNMPMQYDIAQKQLSFLRYFVDNSSANWFVRITDDVYMNRWNLPDFLRDLNARFDPRKDFYIGGCCLDYVGEPLLQGGSGSVFSRYAAELFVSEGLEWLRTVAYYDDWHMSRLLPKLGLSLFNASTGRFMGHCHRTWQRLRYWANVMKRCPELGKLPYCKPLMTRLGDTTFFHDDMKKYDEFGWFNFIHGVPNDVYWYQNGVTAALCRMDR
jgi:hypothetical protein